MVLLDEMHLCGRIAEGLEFARDVARWINQGAGVNQREIERGALFEAVEATIHSVGA